MKISGHFALCVAVGLSVSGFALAEDSQLGKEMERLDDAYKALRATADTGKGAELARDAQNAVQKSLSELPPMLAAMPEGAERAKACASYRQLMGRLYVKLCEVEQAFLANRADLVSGLVDEIKALKKKGHGEFMEEE